MSSRLAFTLPFFALVALSPAASLAAEDCPDGWFCEENAASAPREPAQRPRPVRPSAPPDGDGEAPLGPPPDYPPPSGPPPALADDTIVLDVPEPPPRKRQRRRFREWGFNLHLEAALLGNKSERASNSDMAGLGFALRYRPIPLLAIEGGVDLLTGTDFQGYSRSEAALLLNGLLFFNPHDVIQLYALAGLGFSAASVTISPRAGELPFPRHDEHYAYFGGQLGLGAEVRVTRRVALAGDLIGFVRGRTDDQADTVPEFIDPNTHRATNVSGGGLLRLGATFYW